jgi:hypothetical protein
VARYSVNLEAIECQYAGFRALLEEASSDSSSQR